MSNKFKNIFIVVLALLVGGAIGFSVNSKAVGTGNGASVYAIGTSASPAAVAAPKGTVTAAITAPVGTTPISMTAKDCKAIGGQFIPDHSCFVPAAVSTFHSNMAGIVKTGNTILIDTMTLSQCLASPGGWPVYGSSTPPNYIGCLFQEIQNTASNAVTN